MSLTRVDVVILGWNDGDLLDAAVDSALSSEGVEVKVLVVDNGSDEPVRLAPDRRIRVVRNEENLGVAGGRNQGIRFTDAPFICLLDSDARLHPGTLATLLGPMLEDPRVGVTAPVFTDQLPEASAGCAPTIHRKAARAFNLTNTYRAARRGPGQSSWDVEFAIGACQFVRREAFETVMGLDDRYLFGPEDVDFCLRLRYRGWRVVQVSDARCDHPPRRAHRRLLTRRGLAHASALARHYQRHRSLRGVS
jgi:GT2 family glycosyltransferase